MIINTIIAFNTFPKKTFAVEKQRLRDGGRALLEPLCGAQTLPSVRVTKGLRASGRKGSVVEKLGFGVGCQQPNPPCPLIRGNASHVVFWDEVGVWRGSDRKGSIVEKQRLN